MKILVIKTDNSMEVKEADGYEEMQEVVGGYIETVYPLNAYENKLMTRDNCFVVDEEGLCKEKPINLLGTILYSGTDVSNFSPIVGDIFIVGRGEEDFKGLIDDEVDFYVNKFTEILGGLL